MPQVVLSHKDILRVIKSLVHEALQRIRGDQGEPLFPDQWDERTLLGRDGLEADSLELLELAGRINAMFELHQAGVEEYLIRYRRLGEWAEIVARARELGASGIHFLSSGTTGEPNSSPHAWETLEQEIGELAEIVGRAGRVIAAAPAHHIYGFLLTVMLPRHLEIPVETIGQGRLPGELRPGDLLVSFPLYWRYLSRSLPDFPPELSGVTSTAPCPPELIADLKAKGLGRMIALYGASETGGIGFRDDPEGPYQLFSYWAPVSPDALQRRLPDGSLSEPIPLQDRLEWVDDKRFYPRGRRDGAVPIGGVNVFPGAVAEKLRAHPRVRDCLVRPIDIGGEKRLKAFVVPADANSAPEELKQTLSAWCKTHLDPAGRPVSWTLGERLPRGELGKPGDWEPESQGG